jgi:ribosome-binding ATPase YchF (GTP1/OBG family)
MEEPGLNRVIRAAYHAAGPADLLHRRREGSARLDRSASASTAPQAAGVIHTDFERGFIRAETIAYDDYIACKGEHRRQGGRQDAARGQGLRGAGRRCHALPVQRLKTLSPPPTAGWVTSTISSGCWQHSR